MEELFNRRITNEMKSIHKEPLERIDVYPDPKDFRIWYCLMRGGDDTDYKDGWYMLKVILSKDYPTTPVDIIMMTPSGRFLVNNKICLTITGYHPESWSPVWTIKSCLQAFMSIMASDADKGLAHIFESREERRRKALDSWDYNVTHHRDLLRMFKRFVKDESGILIQKTNEEILAEMPKPKKKKTGASETKKEPTAADYLKMFKLTDGDSETKKTPDGSASGGGGGGGGGGGAEHVADAAADVDEDAEIRAAIAKSLTES